MNTLPESHFSNVDKAAIVLLSMGEDAASKVLQTMERDEVQKVSAAMARLGNITTLDAEFILDDFFGQYTRLSGISGASRGYLEKSLDMALGDRLAQGMLDNIYGDRVSEDLQKLQWLPVEVLAKFFRHEHLQMQAVMLAFLPPETANAVLQHLPQESHDELLYRIANISEISEQVISELKVTLDLCVEFVAEQSGARIDGSRQAANILNRYQGDKAQMMNRLEEYDADIANTVKDNMFDFAILARQSEDVIQALLVELEDGLLPLALKGADSAVKARFIEAMPNRMAQALEDEITDLGAVAISKTELARREIMQLARDLYEQQDLPLQLFEEQVVS